MNSSKINAVLLGLLAVALWAAIPALVKLGSTTDTLSFLLVLRFAISSLIFLPLLRKIWAKRKEVPSKWYALLTLCLAANFFFQGLAMIKLPVSWYLIVFSLNPLFALLLMGIRLTRQAFFGIAVAIIGTLLFVDLHEVRNAYGLLPLLYVTIGMVTWVVYTLITRRFQTQFSNLEITALTQVAALIGCLGIWAADRFPVSELSASTQLLALALGLLTPLAYFGFNACLRTLPRFGIVSQYLEPVFGVAIGVCFFHESLSVMQAIGSLLIVIGSAVMES